MDISKIIEVIYCPEDIDKRAYCDYSDNLCIERFHKNHLLSQTPYNNIRKREQLNKIMSNCK